MTEKFDDMDSESGDFESEEGVAPEQGEAHKKRKPVLTKSIYEVGYGRPPVAYQFQKGRSGNPSGRPKGAANKLPTEIERLKKRFTEMTEQKVPINKGGQIIRMPKIDFILQSAIDKAAKGNTQMMKFVLNLGREIERERKQLQDALTREAIEYKNHWNNVLEDHRRRGIYGRPEPVPHPDDVVIYPNGKVTIKGPLTPEQKKLDQQIVEKRRECIERRQEIKAEIKTRLARLQDRRFNHDRVRAQLRALVDEAANLSEFLEKSDRKDRYE